jgi:hypothetical protein
MSDRHFNNPPRRRKLCSSPKLKALITAVCKANGTSDHFVNKNKLITSLLVALIASAILDEISWTLVR